MKIILEKLSNLETNSVSKDDLSAEIKSLKNEISSLKDEMISKNDIKIEVQTITGKVIVLYVKNTDKIAELKSKIKLKENISEDKLYLFLDYQLLKDDSTIAENNIKETSNLYLMKSDEKILSSALPNEEKYSEMLLETM